MSAYDAMWKVLEVRDAKGLNAKKDVLKNYKDDEDFLSLLTFAFDPFKTYNLSRERILNGIKNVGNDTESNDIKATFHYNDLFEACHHLSGLKGMDNATFSIVISFLRSQPEGVRHFYVAVLSKTLNIGVTAKTINKVIPGLIPEWEVQQAYPIEKYPLKDGVWFSISQKLNGVRVTYYNGSMYGRSGSLILGLSHITRTLDRFPHLVFDGELTLRDKEGMTDNEAFRVATGIINSDDDRKESIQFTIFDIVWKQEFENGQSSEGYRKRREDLDEFSEILSEETHVSILPSLYCGTDQKRIWQLLDKMVAEDKEGLMVNLDVPYKRKRHNGILKVKRFYTMDLRILRCEEGSGRFEGTLGSIVVDYAGTEVGVGSGFSDEQRDWFWSHQCDVVGRLAEVKYKEISYDKTTGKQSLQFPVFVSLRTDKDEVSYG